MSRYKIFNPSDYRMVNGKLLPKAQVGQQTGSGTDPSEENVDLGGGSNVDSDGNAHTVIKNVDGKGTNIYIVRDSSGNVAQTHTYQRDASGAVINDTYVQRNYFTDSDGSQYSTNYIGDPAQGTQTYTGVGTGYGGYDWRREGYEGGDNPVAQRYYKNKEKYAELLNDPANKDMVDAMYAQYSNRVAGSGVPKMTRDEFTEILIRGQQDNALMHSVYGDDMMSQTFWDKPGTWGSGHGLPSYSNTNQAYENAARELGFEAMTPEEVQQFQAAYNASYEVANQPEFIDKFKEAGFQADPKGIKQPGEPGYLSADDKYYGNTTNRYYWSLSEEEEEVVDPPEPGTKTFYYCIEDESGKRVSEPITVKEGESPTPPEGAVSEAYEDLNSVKKICEAEGEILEEATPAPDTWFGNDIRNYLTAASQKIYKGRPNLYQMGPAPFGYALESPDTLIAATTGMSNQYNNLLANTMSGNAAAAASLGAQGTFLNQLAQDIAGVATRNVDRLNTAYGQKSQLDQDTAIRNLEMRKTFGDESAIFGQNLTNAQNAKRALMTEMYNRGEENRYNDELLRYLYPQAKYPNRFNMGRTWDDSGNYKDPLEDTSNPENLTTDCFGVYEDSFNQYMQSTSIEMDDETKRKNAHDFAQNAQAECYRRGRSNNNQTRSYAQAALNQRNNQGVDPRMMMQRHGGPISFGASYATPWGKKY